MGPQHQDDDESLAPRWSAETEKHIMAQPILWCCVARDGNVLASVCTDEDPKIPKVALRMMKKEPKTGWDYYTYAVQSQKRLVQAAKFHIYERVPFQVGRRAKLNGLRQNTFLNGQTVRILDYYPDTDKYLIRPTVPLPEDQKLSTTGQLLVKSEFLVSDHKQEKIVWTFACLYDGHCIDQGAVCSFLEKIMMIAQDFLRKDEWKRGDVMACQKSFGPIIQAQIEQFAEKGPDAVHDESLEFSKEMIARNINIISDGL